MKSVTQTTQLAVCLAALIASGLAANADGRITKLEGLGIVVSNAGKMIEAAKGITEIPEELKDLQPHEWEEIYFAVLTELNLENDNDARLKIGRVYDLLRQIMLTMEAFREPPFDGPVPAPPSELRPNA